MATVLKEWVESVGRFVHDQFTTLVLCGLFVGLLAFTLHMSHDSMDKDMVSWGREQCGVVLGALMLLLKAMPKQPDPNTTKTQATVIETVADPKP